MEGRGYRFTPLLGKIERDEVSIINVQILLLTLRANPVARFLVKSTDSVRVAKSHAREQHARGDASSRDGIGKGRFSPVPGSFAARLLVLSHRGSLTVRHTWRVC